MSSTRRIFRSFALVDAIEHLRFFLEWACDRSEVVALLNSCGIKHGSYNEFDAVLALDVHNEVCPGDGENAFEQWKNFVNENQEWLFGFLSYDLKNQTEDLTSKHYDGIKMPLLHFFIPDILIFQRGNIIEIGLFTEESDGYLHESLFAEMLAFVRKEPVDTKVEINSRVSREKYIKNVVSVKESIKKGDIYETNYCIEFYSENASIDPVSVYDKLNHISPAPFSCFYKYHDQYLLSSSPERFLAKRSDKLVSQPIKGTAPRHADPQTDKELKEKLFNDPKERSENIMIVDLVRNDLSQSARRGTVTVEELCGVYSYQHVHQMTSTVSCRLRNDVHLVDAIKHAFPMGSMTGAPKIRAMEIIEAHEVTKRGLYSGTVGYISPCGNIDFNVIIRSILYNKANNFLSFMAGSAITILSEPEKEYQECLLKAQSLARVLGANINHI